MEITWRWERGRQTQNVAHYLFTMASGMWTTYFNIPHLIETPHDKNDVLASQDFCKE